MPSVEELERGRPREFDDPEKLRSSLRRLMWGKVGLVRSGDSLISASAQLAALDAASDKTVCLAGGA